MVDAIYVHKVINPHKAFQHMLDIFVQHLFFIQQAQSVVGEIHKMSLLAPGTNWVDWSNTLGGEMYLQRALKKLNLELSSESVD